MPLNNTQIVIIIIVFFVIVTYLWYSMSPKTIKSNEAYTQSDSSDLTIGNVWNKAFSIQESLAKKITDYVAGNGGKKEAFFGGYSYFWDYPFYNPYFYSGCNEDVFSNITCLPIAVHPFW